jgi:hypothetical protein
LLAARRSVGGAYLIINALRKNLPECARLRGLARARGEESTRAFSLLAERLRAI